MKEVLAGLQASILWICLVALVALASVVIAAGMGRAAMRAKKRLRRASAGVAALAIACTLFARKGGYVSVTDPYILDNGSYLTNDVAHVSLAKKTPLLPDETEILVYARPLSSTNAADWVRLEPHLTFADHPYDYPLAVATNWNVMVAANYTPAPTVHTNGVWQIRGFTIPDSGGKAAFPNTKIKPKEDQ